MTSAELLELERLAKIAGRGLDGNPINLKEREFASYAVVNIEVVNRLISELRRAREALKQELAKCERDLPFWENTAKDNASDFSGWATLAVRLVYTMRAALSPSDAGGTG